MVVEIGGIRFFNPVKFTEGHNYKRIPVTKKVSDTLKEGRIFSGVYDRWGVDKEFILFPDTGFVEKYTTFFAAGHLYTMGAFSYSRTALPVNTIIGRYTSIAANMQRMGIGHPTTRFSVSNVTYQDNIPSVQAYKDDYKASFSASRNDVKNHQPIIIGNDVWIGDNVTVSGSGISIGNGAVVATKAVVTKDVPPYAIVGGIPAKVLKYRFSEEIIAELQTLEWWQYDMGGIFEEMPMDVPIDVFIERVKQGISDGTLKTFDPGVTNQESLTKQSNQ